MEAETHLLDILNKGTALLQFDEWHTYFFQMKSWLRA